MRIRLQVPHASAPTTRSIRVRLRTHSNTVRRREQRHPGRSIRIRLKRTRRAQRFVDVPVVDITHPDFDPSLLSQEELATLTKSLESQIHAQEPDTWVEDVCHEFLWSKQREIARAVVDHRRVAVHSCHGPGKSFIASRIAAWWLSTHKAGEAFVITSAPTGRQVRAILWREIGRIHAKANLPGRTNQTEWHMTMPEGNEEIVAFGMKPADMDPTAFQGVHAPFILVIFDEACGMPDPLWDAADTLLSNDDSRMLVIGNPDDPETQFHEVCKPGSGWYVVGISALDTPNFTGEHVPPAVARQLIGKIWVEEKKRKWGEDNPMYVSKVLGQFPVTSIDGLIPMRWIRLAQEREMRPGFPNELGVDIGGGGDPNIIAHRRGPVVRIIRKDTEPDTMITTGHIIQALRQTEADVAKVDEIGIGRGVVNRGKEQGHPFVGINGASKPTKTGIDPKTKKPIQEFANLRAEGFWHLRELFQDGQIDIDSQDDDLAAQLAALKYFPNSKGQTVIMSKKDMKKDKTTNVNHSTDEADAVMLAFINPPAVKKYHSAVWGTQRRAA